MAVKALGRMRAEGSIPKICRTMRDPEWWPRSNAGEALRALTGIDELTPRVVRSGFFANRPTGRVAPLQLELLRVKPSLQAAE